MLAIGRALMARPRMLMLDEPSTGLAPQVVADDLRHPGRAQTRRNGRPDRRAERVSYARHADRAYVFENGAIALSGTAAQLHADPSVRAIYLGGSTDET